jgi:CheY-like chemotaxis protein
MDICGARRRLAESFTQQEIAQKQAIERGHIGADAPALSAPWLPFTERSFSDLKTRAHSTDSLDWSQSPLSQLYDKSAGTDDAHPEDDGGLPDLIVTDHIMPGLTGLDLCQRVRSDQYANAIPIILHTGTDLSQICTGLDDCLVEKPTIQIDSHREFAGC